MAYGVSTGPNGEKYIVKQHEDGSITKLGDPPKSQSKGNDGSKK